MTDNIVKIEYYNTKDINTADMLKAIAEENPKNAFVVVWPEGGSMPTYHCNTSDVAVVLMRVNEFVHKYYNGDFDD